MTHTKKTRLLTAVFAAMLVVMGGSAAHADWDHRGYDGGWHGRDGDWRRHEEWRHRDWDRWHGPQPGYVYAPPVAYEPPPPVAPGLNLILPINFQ